MDNPVYLAATGQEEKIRQEQQTQSPDEEICDPDEYVDPPCASRRKSWPIVVRDKKSPSIISSDDVPLRKSFRKYIVMICMLSMIVTFSTQSSMSSALVCIVPTDTPNATAILNNETIVHPHSDWRMHWNKQSQGWALSSFFLGYFISQFPSGLAVTKWGPKKVLVGGLFITSIVQGLAVPAARFGLEYLYIDRAIAGVIDGFLYAPTYALLGQWAPKPEASLLFAFVGSGMEFGNMASFVVSLFACEIPIQGGWPFLFYTLSALGFITALTVAIFMSDSPYTNKYISAKELNFIAGNVPKVDTKDSSLKKVPFKAILTSMPVWAVIVSQLGTDWFYYLFITVSPQYLKEVLKFNEFETNLLSGVPFVFSLTTIYISGTLSDKLVSKKIVTNTTMRKINDFICKIIPSCAFMGLAFLQEGSIYTAFVLNTIIAVTTGFCFVSWMANPIDLAPAYTGVIVGLCEGTTLWVAVVIPVLVEVITKDKTREQWQLAFYITVGLQVVTYIFYAIFASGELQPWAASSYGDSSDTDGKKSNSKSSRPSTSGSIASSYYLPAITVSDTRRESRPKQHSLSEDATGWNYLDSWHPTSGVDIELGSTYDNVPRDTKSGVTLQDTSDVDLLKLSHESTSNAQMVRSTFDNTSNVDLLGSTPDNTNNKDLLGSTPDNTGNDDLLGSTNDNTNNSNAQMVRSTFDNTSNVDLLGSTPDNTNNKDLLGSTPDNTSNNDLLGSTTDNTTNFDLLGSNVDNTPHVHVIGPAFDNATNIPVEELAYNSTSNVHLLESVFNDASIMDLLGPIYDNISNVNIRTTLPSSDKTKQAQV